MKDKIWSDPHSDVGSLAKQEMLNRM